MAKPDRIAKFLATQEGLLRRAQRQYIAGFKAPKTRKEIETLLREGKIVDIMSIIDNRIQQLGHSLNTIFQNSAEEEYVYLVRRYSALGVQAPIGFDLPRAAEKIRANRALFTSRYAKQQSTVTRNALVGALLADGGGVDTFLESIGLNSNQWAALRKYKQLLALQSSEALRLPQRQPEVAGILKQDEPVRPSPPTLEEAARMAERYRLRLTNSRVETISRTEARRAFSVAQQEAVEQFLNQTGINPNAAVRIWTSVLIPTTRDTHEEMHGQERDLYTPFESSSGARLQYPGDPTAPASEVVNCLCTVRVELRPE